MGLGLGFVLLASHQPLGGGEPLAEAEVEQHGHLVRGEAWRVAWRVAWRGVARCGEWRVARGEARGVVCAWHCAWHGAGTGPCSAL